METSRPRLSTLRYYATLSVSAGRALLDLGMMVVGVGLVGLGFAVLLRGMALIDPTLELSTGAVLVSSLVLGVSGAFALGVTSEGGMRAARRLIGGFHPLEAAAARVVAAALVGILLLVVAGRLGPLVADLPFPLQVGVAAVHAAGAAAFVVAPLGTALVWLLVDWLHWDAVVPGLDVPVVFLVWAVAAMMLYHPPV